MLSELTTSSAYTDFNALANLKYEAGKKNPEAIKAAAKQFEAMFINMIIKNMREINKHLGTDLLGGSGVDMYTEMLDQQMAMNMVKSQSLGLAKAVERQLMPKDMQEDERPDADSANKLDISELLSRSRIHANYTNEAAVQSSAKPVSSSQDLVSQKEFSNPVEFVKSLLPHALEYAKELGVNPKVLLAQAAIETGWGKHEIKHTDGRRSHNLFNIKVGSNWEQDRVMKRTLEYRDGIPRKESAVFRSYSSYAEAFSDYVDFIKTKPRYQSALNSAYDSSAYLSELQQAGYATDPKYADKIMSIFNGDTLNDAIYKVTGQRF